MRKLRARMSRYQSSELPTPSFELMPRALQEGGLHTPTLQKGASLTVRGGTDLPTPTSISFLVLTLISARGSLSRGWNSRLPAHAKAEVALLAIKGNVVEVEERDFWVCLSSDQPLSIFASKQREKPPPPSPPSPHAGGPLGTIPLESALLKSMQCVLHPQLCKGSAPPRVQSRINPSQGKGNLPKKSPKHGSPGAMEAPLPLETLHVRLSVWDGEQ